MKNKIKPLGDRVLVKPHKADEKTSGGIIIPEAAQERPLEGEVVALGDGAKTEDGKPLVFAVKEGDRVFYSKYGGTEIKIEGDNFIIIREEELIAVIGE
jgi:chaperonin GroES